MNNPAFHIDTDNYPAFAANHADDLPGPYDETPGEDLIALTQTALDRKAIRQPDRWALCAIGADDADGGGLIVQVTRPGWGLCLSTGWQDIDNYLGAVAVDHPDRLRFALEQIVSEANRLVAFHDTRIAESPA